MNSEYNSRILTSLALLPVLILCCYYSGFYLIFFLIIIFFLSFFEIIKNTKNILFNIFASSILILALFSFYYLRGDTDYSLITIYWILFSTFLSDTGGYIFGKMFKGKKLTKISPNKTYSGSIGSIFLSLTSIPFIHLTQLILFKENLINFLNIKFLCLTISISVVCQLGDLFVSFCKRKKKIKNMSNLLPGHGGVLDRIDGLIFVLIFNLILKKINLI